MAPPFVKKFDFRGIYNKVIFDRDAYYLGLALQKTLPLKKVLLGWDTRESSKNLAMHFINALKDKDIAISYMDKCPIDYVTVGANAFDFDLSIMFTGSHHPWNWTGLLMHTKGGDSIQGDMVEKIVEQYYEAAKEPYNPGPFDAHLLEGFKNFYPELEAVYSQKLQALLPFGKIKPYKVLVDVGDGSGSRSLWLLEKLLPQVKFVRLNDRQVYNAESPHTADPSEIDTMKEVMIDTKKGGYDAGFAFDSDADRVLAIDEAGEYLNGSLLGGAMSEVFVAQNLDDKLFGYAVDCGPSLPNALTMLDGAVKSIPVPVGRSILRKMIRDGKLDFGVENVGHFYAKDFFMTDSGVFSLAVILYWMSMNGALSTLKQKYPDGKRGQIFIPVALDEKDNAQHLYDAINTRYKEGFTEKKIEADGVRYEFWQEKKLVNWYTMRKSGYEQVEKYYYGSLSDDEFIFLKKTFEDLFEEKKKK